MTSIAFRKCVRVCPSQRVDSPWQVFTTVARSNQMYNYELQPGGASDNKRSHTCMGSARVPLFFNNSSTCLCQSKRKLRIRLRRKLPLGGNVNLINYFALMRQILFHFTYLYFFLRWFVNFSLLNRHSCWRNSSLRSL